MLQFVVLKVSCLLLLAHSIYASMPNEAAGEAPKASSSALGALYRTARDGYRTYDQRCTTCGQADGGYGGMMRYDDRSYDNYFYRRGGGSGGYYGANMQGRGGYEDRNWYYQPDRYDDRYRNYDRYSGDKYGSRYFDDRYGSSGYGYYSRPMYDDRYDSRAPSYGYHDRYEMQMRYPTNDYRGNGYDNRDSYYMEQMRGDYNRGSDRFYGTTGYDRDYYERPMSGYQGYDYRNFRPVDETYSGISGFDNSGRGYYFASRPPYSRPPVQPHSPPSYHQSTDSRPPQAPYDSTHKPAPYLPTGGQHHSGNSGNTAEQNRPHDNREYGSGGHTGDVPSPGIGTHGTEKGYAGGWSYESDRNNVHSSNKDKDTQSSAYGSRPRPLGTSYLHEREESPEMGKKMNDEKSAEPTVSKDKDENTQG